MINRLLSRIESLPASLVIMGESIRISAEQPIPPDLAAEIRANKAAIIQHLTGKAPPANIADNEIPEPTAATCQRTDLDSAGKLELPSPDSDASPAPSSLTPANECEDDGGQGRDTAGRTTIDELVPCRCCKGKSFWVGTMGTINCLWCSPPADPWTVVRWIELPVGDLNEKGDSHRS